jgi:protocatechuate 3,4-dioxygenase beta subunit
MYTDDVTRFNLTRRGFVISGAAALVCPKGIAATPTCTLTAEQEEGPYYVDYEQVRPDITEAKLGLPLKLRIALVDSKRCAALENAALDIWHCDASGVYSGFTSNSPDGGGGPEGRRGPGGPGGPGRGFGDFGAQGFGPGMPPPPGRGPGGPGGPGGRRQIDATRFLRGVQMTDKQGLVEFATLYPGWYFGRAIHIHMKVHLGGSVSEGKYAGGHVSHTGQLFFPEDVTDEVAKLQPYAKRLNIHRTLQTEDGIFNGQHGASCMVNLTRLKNGTNAEGFLATVTLAVDPDATPAPVGIGGRGGRRGPGPGPGGI